MKKLQIGLAPTLLTITQMYGIFLSVEFNRF